jgi:hypothetical protein
VSTCAIRYRLDGPGPAAFIVECDGRHHLYTRGALGAALPDYSLTAMLGARGYRWVPASGDLILDRRRPAPRAEFPLPLVPTTLSGDMASMGDSSVAMA